MSDAPPSSAGQAVFRFLLIGWVVAVVVVMIVAGVRLFGGGSSIAEPLARECRALAAACSATTTIKPGTPEFERLGETLRGLEPREVWVGEDAVVISLSEGDTGYVVARVTTASIVPESVHEMSVIYRPRGPGIWFTRPSRSKR
ncbi:MAG TPA: hypothetical protein DEA08_24235 [Planctomycetes bacterium]|nr:hypothetical protein [Planctomycetota bacterium]